MLCKQTGPISSRPDLLHSAIYQDFLYYLFLIVIIILLKDPMYICMHGVFGVVILILGDWSKYRKWIMRSLVESTSNKQHWTDLNDLDLIDPSEINLIFAFCLVLPFKGIWTFLHLNFWDLYAKIIISSSCIFATGMCYVNCSRGIYIYFVSVKGMMSWNSSKS